MTRDNEYRVEIRGDLADDDGLHLDMGETSPGHGWWEIPLPPCPDCGGDLVWFEAGYVPGTRKCLGKPLHDDVYALDGGCGSLFSVQVADGRAFLRRERLF